MPKRYHPIKDTRPAQFYGPFDVNQIYVNTRDQSALITFNETFYSCTVDTGPGGIDGATLGWPALDNGNWQAMEVIDTTSTDHLTTGPVTINRLLTIGEL